jgi:Protein of unknown function (DUF2946)
MTLKLRTLSLAKWLALLAIGMQLVLPLSVGLQINTRGAAAMLAAFETELCLADHAGAAPVADTGDRSEPGKSPSDNAGGCPLCLVLQVLHAFTDSPVAALPLPSVSGKTLGLATHDAATATPLTASYRSRAPPTLS